MTEETGRAGEPTAAEEFDELFRAVYHSFHRRDAKRSELPGASRAVLTHLAMAGPVTVGEAAAHLNRAQSVVSDIVSGLEGKGLLAREPDPLDRRRHLVWLTPAGLEAMAADRRVLSTELLDTALAALAPADHDALVVGLRALLAAAPRPDSTPTRLHSDPT